MFRIFLVQLAFIGVFSKTIPSFLHVCKKHDVQLSQCILKTVQELMPALKDGIPELDLPPLEPLNVPKLYINSTATSIKMDAEITNTVVHGLSDLITNTVTANPDLGNFGAVVYIPRIRLQGNYKMNGKVMLFQINGKGIFDFNATDITANANWNGTFYMKNGNQHLKFDSIGVNLSMGYMEIRFENLFKSNDNLTQSINQLINQHIHELQTDLNPIITELIGKIATGYFNRVYSLYTLDQLYPNDDK